LKIKILITLDHFGKFSKEPLIRLSKISNQIIFLEEKDKNNHKILKEVLKDTDYYIAGTERIDKNILESAEKLKIICRGGIGYDSVDLLESKKRNIIVTNTPNIAAQSVSELALSFLTLRLRNILQYNYQIKSMAWRPKINLTALDLNIGIIGVGNIGRKFLNFIKPLNFKNIYLNDVRPIKFHEKKMQWKSKNFIYKNCDIISLHIPLNNKTKNLINKKIFKIMKKDLAIINTSRGGIVNESDLHNFLKKNNNASAYMDVFDKEPIKGPLIKLNNIFMTPHIGSMTKQSRIIMDSIAVDELLRFHRNKKVKFKVN